MTIVEKILACFGYVKVPKSAIEISLIHEELIKNFIKLNPNVTILKTFLESQKTLTRFLQVGRLLQ